MSADTSKMEEVINKPDDQFEDTLRHLIDYGKDTSEKEALIKEIYQNEASSHHHIKPAASINSSTYSSAASSLSSSSSSSTNSNASSTSSTLSSPSQSNITTLKSSSSSTSSNDQEKDSHNKANANELEEVEMAIFEDLGKTATIVEHKSADPTTGRYFQFHDPRLPGQYRAVIDSSKIRSASNNLTITKNLGSRKKRPVEQPVLAKDIPGHKGEKAVDWLVNFIESGATNQSTNNKRSNANTNKRAKSQLKNSNQTESERDSQQSRKIGNVNGSNTTNNTANKVAPSNHQRPIQYNVNKTVQHSQIAPMQQPPISQRKSQPPPTINNHKQTNHQMMNNNSISANKSSRPSRGYKESDSNEASGKQSNSSKATSVVNKKTVDILKQSYEEAHNAVTFADHIKIRDDEDTAQYTFGFFDDQKPRIMKTSPKSDQRRYMFNDNIDANSFNYKQILDFISKSWKQTVARSMTKSTS